MWLALIRELDSTPLLERPVTDMVVAWLDQETYQREIDRYIEWDMLASADCRRWTVVSFPRTPRRSYFREYKDADDLIDYHFVLADWNVARKTGVVSLQRSWGPESSQR